MKDKRSLHLKVQELCDCFATNDPLKEMSLLEKEKDEDEAALKWLALATLHGINANAKQISIAKSGNGKVEVKAQYRETLLPNPGLEIGGKIIEVVRGVTHLEEEKGKTDLALGIRDGSIEMNIKLEKKDDIESVTIKFPK
jgi:hypothetical protein